VKNLKSKDYLGKARLVAAADRPNAFAGLAGSENKKVTIREDLSRDDRAPENISFGATNLVKPGLQSRGRQQSEPPINRHLFPPTPPPEGEKAASFASSQTTAGVPGMTGRAGFVRSFGSKPEKLDLMKIGLEKERPRLGTMRTASEPRGPTRKYSTARMQEPPSRERLFGETTNRRAHGAPAEDDYPQEIYHTYRSPRSSNGTRRKGSKSQWPAYINEEEEYVSDTYERSSLDEPDFEIVGGTASQYQHQQRRPSRGASRRPEVRKIRVKVHADDTRYLMISADLEFAEFVERIREKFAIKGRFKCKLRDDGDMITMGDQDDLDMAFVTCKEDAERQGSDMGKMEVSFDLSLPFESSLDALLTDPPGQVWVQPIP